MQTSIIILLLLLAASHHVSALYCSSSSMALPAHSSVTLCDTTNAVFVHVAWHAQGKSGAPNMNLYINDENNQITYTTFAAQGSYASLTIFPMMSNVTVLSLNLLENATISYTVVYIPMWLFALVVLLLFAMCYVCGCAGNACCTCCCCKPKQQNVRTVVHLQPSMMESSPLLVNNRV